MIKFFLSFFSLLLSFLSLFFSKKRERKESKESKEFNHKLVIFLERDNFSSRVGFILVSAGCAIGLGNVWRFPFITGEYGGGAFVLLYLVFLLFMGLPVLVAELAVGRASQRSIAMSFDALEPKGTKWHLHKYTGIVGNIMLMMFYTTISGWMLYYLYKMASGAFHAKNAEVPGIFANL